MTATTPRPSRRLRTELRALDAKLARARALDAADRAEPGTPISGDEKLNTEIRSRFKVTRAIAHAAGLAVDAGFEREVQSELARRAGRAPQGMFIPAEVFETRVLTTATGSELVPTEHRPDQYVSALTASSVVRGMGARVLTGLAGNLSIPRETASPAIGWVAENAALSNSDANFDSITLSPKHAGALSEFSRNMLLQASPDVEALLRQMLARNLALAIDKAAIKGGGANEPSGVLQTAGIQTHAYTTDLFTSVRERGCDVRRGECRDGAPRLPDEQRRQENLLAPVGREQAPRLRRRDLPQRARDLLQSGSDRSGRGRGTRDALRRLVRVVDRRVVRNRYSREPLRVFGLCKGEYQHPRDGDGRLRRSPSGRFRVDHGRHDRREGHCMMTGGRDIERRAFTEIRATGRRLEGYAATFGAEARIGSFVETIAPGAFRASLAGDVLALMDHDGGKVLGRTKSGTLRLTEDSRGLAFSLDLPDTAGRARRAGARRARRPWRHVVRLHGSGRRRGVGRRPPHAARRRI
jgi:hypothetical protein